MTNQPNNVGAAGVLSDEQMMAAIKSVCGFDAEKAEQWRTEALMIGRAVEREVLATSSAATVSDAGDRAINSRLLEIALAYGFGPAMLASGNSAVAGEPEKFLPMLSAISSATVSDPAASAHQATGQAAPEGYALVPINPTQAMLDAGYWPCTQGRGAKSVWGEMMRVATGLAPSDAAPSPAAREAGDGVKFDLNARMTPFGMLVRALRIVAGTTLYDMAKHLQCSSAMLSGVEFGRKPLTDAMVADTAAYFSSLGIHDTLHALIAARLREAGSR